MTDIWIDGTGEERPDDSLTVVIDGDHRSRATDQGGASMWMQITASHLPCSLMATFGVTKNKFVGVKQTTSTSKGGWVTTPSEIWAGDQLGCFPQPSTRNRCLGGGPIDAIAHLVQPFTGMTDLHPWVGRTSERS